MGWHGPVGRHGVAVLECWYAKSQKRLKHGRAIPHGVAMPRFCPPKLQVLYGLADCGLFCVFG